MNNRLSRRNERSSDNTYQRKSSQEVAPENPVPGVVDSSRLGRWRLPLMIFLLGNLLLLGCFWALPTHWSLKADAAMATGRLTEAGHYYRSIESLRPRSPVAALGQARIARLNGDPSLARALLVTAQARGASAGQLSVEKKLLKIQSGAAAAMVERFPSMLIQHPEYGADIFCAYARGFARLGLHEQSLGYASHWMEQMPSDPNAALLKAEALEALDNLQLAEQHYEKAISINPKLLPARRGLATLKLALDKPSEALPLFQSVVADGEGDIDCVLLLAKTEVAMGHNEEAIRLLCDLIDADPGSFAARHFLATRYVEVGRSSDAVDTLLPILPQFPDDVSIHYLLANAYSDLNQTERAGHHTERHLEGRKRLNELDAMARQLGGNEGQNGVSNDQVRAVIEGYLRYQWDLAEPWLVSALDEIPDQQWVYELMSEFCKKRSDLRRAREFRVAATARAK
jgi:tetratricopeptide (TPR) repeat protein